MIRDFIRSSAAYTIPAVVARGLSIFLVPIYTRVLSPTEYGALDILTVFEGLALLTVALEISQGLARNYASASDSHERIRYASTALWFSVGAHLCFLLAAQLVAQLVARALLGTDELTSAFRLISIRVAINGTAMLLHTLLRFQLRSKEHVIGSVLMVVVTGVLSVVLTYVYGLGVNGMIIGLVGGSSTLLIYSGYALRGRIAVQFSRRHLREMLAFSLPLVPSGLSVFAAKFVDRIMIRHFLSLEEIGIYGIGFRLASLVGLLMVGVRAALTPIVYAKSNDPETPRSLESIFRLFIAACLVLSAALAIFAPEILSVFAAAEYGVAASVVPLLVPAVLLSSMYIFMPGPFLRKKTSWVLGVNVTGALLNAVFNFLLIPVMGYQGAALATLCGNLVAFVLYVIVSQRFYPVAHKWARLIVGTIAASGITALGVSLETIGVLPVILKFLLLCGVVASVLVFGLVKGSEIAAATRIVRGSSNTTKKT